MSLNLKVSVITACYNSAETISDCIHSVNNQSYNNIEHIFIDGKSDDNTIEIIEKVSDFKTKLISEKDDGLYYAMNKGIDLADGDIIAILNSDDFYNDENVVSDIVEIFNSDKIDAVYADLNYVSYNKEKITREWISGKYKKGSFKWGWMPPHPTLFLKKEIYNKYGKFNTQFKSAADYELMLRFIHKNEINISYLPRTIVNMRAGGISNASFKNRLRANSEDMKAWKINNLEPHILTRFLKPLRKIIQFI